MAAAAAAVALPRDTQFKLINNFINFIDIFKDAFFLKKNQVAAARRARFLEIVNPIFNTPIVTANPRYRNNENISTHSFKSEVARAQALVTEYNGEAAYSRYNICLLRHFEDAKVDLIPNITSAEVQGIQYAVQDSGTLASDYNERINTLVSPGAFLDPGARRRKDPQTEFMNPSSVNLRIEDFERMGYINSYVTALNVTRDGGIYIFTYTLVGGAQLRFRIDNEYNMDIDEVDNRYIKGNREKNTWLNEHLANRDLESQVKKYIYMKLLGDFLQVIYADKFVSQPPPAAAIPRTNIAIFTSDSLLALRAKLYRMPYVYEDRQYAQTQGIDCRAFTFITQAGAINSNRIVNQFVASRIRIHNNNVISRLQETHGRGNIRVKGRLVRFNDNARACLLEIVANINTANARLPVIDTNSEIVVFRGEANKYMATNLVITKDNTAVSVKKIFQLLENNDPLNMTRKGNQQFDNFIRANSIDIDNNEGNEEDEDNNEENEDNNEENEDNNEENEDNNEGDDKGYNASKDVGKKRGRKGPGKEGNPSKRQRKKGPPPPPPGGQAVGVRGGYKGCEVTDIYTYHDETLENDYYEEYLYKKCPSDAVLQCIRDYGITEEYNVYTIFVILYPYFQTLGAYTVKKEFYTWAVKHIIDNMESDEQFVNYTAFETNFKEIHGGVDVNVDGELPDIPEEKNSEPGGGAGASGRLLGTTKKAPSGPNGSPYRPSSSSSSSGSPLAATPYTGTHATYATGATLTGMSALGIGETPDSASATPGLAISMAKVPASGHNSNEETRGRRLSIVGKKLFEPNETKGGNRLRHKTRIRRKSKKLRKYRKTRKLRRNKSTK